MPGAIEKAFGVAHDVVDALDQLLPSDADAIAGEDVVQHKAAPQESPGSRRPRTSAYAARAAVAGRPAPAMLPPAPAPTPAPANSTALAAPAARRVVPFRMVEATNDDGQPVWVVTDGVEYAVCNTKSFAERVRDALG